MTDLEVGAAYKVSFFEAARTWGGGQPYPSGNRNDLRVIIDEGLDTEVMIYNNPDVDNITWEQRTSDQFVAIKPSYNLTFRSTNPRGGDCGTLIDGVLVVDSYEPYVFAGPSPEYDSYVGLDSELELSWTNIDPNDSSVPSVWVDVWFVTDPNDYNDFNKVVDGVEDANSATVDVSVAGTYYWKVNTYIYGSPTGDPIEGLMWKFNAASDPPVSVDAGANWVTWTGITGKVQLDGSIDGGASDLIIDGWGADDPNVVFDPNEFVEDPTITITKVTDNPSIVMLTLSAHDDASSDEDTIRIEVYRSRRLCRAG